MMPALGLQDLIIVFFCSGFFAFVLSWIVDYVSGRLILRVCDKNDGSETHKIFMIYSAVRLINYFIAVFCFLSMLTVYEY